MGVIISVFVGKFYISFLYFSQLHFEFYSHYKPDIVFNRKVKLSSILMTECLFLYT